MRAVLLFVSFYLRLSVSSLFFYFLFLHSMPWGLVFHFLFNPTGFIKPNQMRALLIPLHLNRCGETSKRIFVCIRRRIILRNVAAFCTGVAANTCLILAYCAKNRDYDKACMNTALKPVALTSSTMQHMLQQSDNYDNTLK